MKLLSVNELKSWRDSGKAHQLIDVREDHERDAGHINGDHIKMGEILDCLDQVSNDLDVVIHCKSGARSGAVVQELERKGYTNIYNLDGGISAWAEQIDNSLTVL